MIELAALRENKTLIYSTTLILHWPEYPAESCFQQNGYARKEIILIR